MTFVDPEAKLTVDLRVYAIVDPEHAGGHTLPDLARMLAAGGATLIQLRDKIHDTAAMVELARAIKAALPAGVPLIVNDRVDVAQASGADGVHLGQEDMSVVKARDILGPAPFIGLSVKTIEQAKAAPLGIIDYVGIGGVFGTTSKNNVSRPIGPDGLARIVRVFRDRIGNFPMCGIAGITAANAEQVIAAGADGVSVISALSLAPDPTAATRELRAVVDAARAKYAPTPPAVGAAGHQMGERMTAIALTIAGSDSSGGAGIQADLKTFAALGVYGASAITALTAQNTQGVTAIHEVPPEFVTAQIDAVFSDLAVGAVKIGMLANVGVIVAVAAALDRWKVANVVLDPVMVATSGDRLLKPDAVDALKRELIPRARVVTPNMPEAAALLDTGIAADEREMEAQADGILALGAKAVLIKGGHGTDVQSTDVLFDGPTVTRLAAKRIATRNTHGTGCTLSAAIAAGLAKGQELAVAARIAKAYVTEAIAAADRLEIGHGHGPLHHFHAVWPSV